MQLDALDPILPSLMTCSGLLRKSCWYVLGNKMRFITGEGSGEVTHKCVLVKLLVSAGIDSGCCDRMGDEHPDISSALHSSVGHSSLWGSWHQDFVSETGRGHRAIMPRWEISQALQTKARK